MCDILKEGDGGCVSLAQDFPFCPFYPGSKSPFWDPYPVGLQRL